MFIYTVASTQIEIGRRDDGNVVFHVVRGFETIYCAVLPPEAARHLASLLTA